LILRAVCCPRKDRSVSARSIAAGLPYPALGSAAHAGRSPCHRIDGAATMHETWSPGVATVSLRTAWRGSTLVVSWPAGSQGIPCTWLLAAGRTLTARRAEALK
jgi:hypothetical protein